MRRRSAAHRGGKNRETEVFDEEKGSQTADHQRSRWIERRIQDAADGAPRGVLQQSIRGRNSGYFGHGKGITGLEDKEMLKQKMGEERFTLCMQLYAYFEDMFKLASGDLKFDMQHVINSGNEYDNKRLVYLRLDINDLRQRISTLEKIIGERTNLQLCVVC